MPGSDQARRLKRDVKGNEGAIKKINFSGNANKLLAIICEETNLSKYGEDKK